jgi:hypothetical protein
LEPLERDAQIAWGSKLFLAKVWPHTAKSFEERDRGFERAFRHHMFEKFRPTAISSVHDLSFGAGLGTLSGLHHELDLLSRWDEQEWVFELKNGGGCEINKEMLMVFQEKTLDFYFANYGFLSSLRIMRGFLTGAGYVDDHIRAYCAAWGIVLIDNELFPLPALPALLAEKKRWLGRGELPGVEEDEIYQAEIEAEQLIEAACRPLGDIVELSDLQNQLLIRVDRMHQGFAALGLVKRHRSLCALMTRWDSLRARQFA